MLESVSPYALLCASKPKPVPSVVTAYDLYSAAQQAGSPPYSAPPASTPANEPAQMQPAAPEPFTPTRRTHYISDIHARHTTASARSRPAAQPLT